MTTIVDVRPFVTAQTAEQLETAVKSAEVAIAAMEAGKQRDNAAHWLEEALLSLGDAVAAAERIAREADAAEQALQQQNAAAADTAARTTRSWLFNGASNLPMITMGARSASSHPDVLAALLSITTAANGVVIKAISDSSRATEAALKAWRGQ